MRALLALALVSWLPVLAQGKATPKETKAAPAAAATKAAPAPAPDKKAAPAAAFVGNKESKTFHKADCKMAAKLKDANKVTFATKAEAEKAGFKACKVCKP